MFKRALLLLLVLAVCLPMFPAGALADGESESAPTEAPTPKPTPVATEPPTPAPTPAVTEAPATEAPATDVPATEPPKTDVPATDAPQTNAPELSATPGAAETPEDTAAPETTDLPTPTPVPEKLKVKLSSNSLSAFAGGSAIGVSLCIEGGAPEYSVQYQVTLNGKAVAKSDPIATTEAASSYSYVPRAYGVHTFTATVTDASGQTASDSVTVPVAEHDTTSAAAMRKKAQSVKLTGDWRADLLAVAASQLGYRESKRDFIVLADGKTQGYTVYGDWYGLPYVEWCAMFIAYCTNYAGIPSGNVPREASCQRLMNAMNARGAYFTRAGGYEPAPGDIVFFNWDAQPDPDHVGIVETVTDSAIKTIEGNHSRSVMRVSHARSDSQIMGYASMAELMRQAGLLESPRTVEEVQALIDALPTVEALMAMGANLQSEFYQLVQDAYDAYMALSEEDRAQITGAEKFAALFAFFNGQIMALAYSGGSGTADDPYRISTPEDMRALAATGGDWDKCFRLASDINLGGESSPWTPIGDGSAPFTGTFDGDGHRITGLYVNSDGDDQGLFGRVGEGGVIRNVTVAGIVTGRDRVGGVVGSNSGAVIGCANIAAITGRNEVGGIAGRNLGGRVENCCNTGRIVGVGDYNTEENAYTGGKNVGGVVGSNSANGSVVANCYSAGTVTGNENVGGVVGSNSANGSVVANCYNAGTVTGNENVGGIAGAGAGAATNCYYLDTCGADGAGTRKTGPQFASGEVAWLLQGEQSTLIWGQELGRDVYPVLTDDAAKRVWHDPCAAAGYYSESNRVSLPEGGEEPEDERTIDVDSAAKAKMRSKRSDERKDVPEKTVLHR